MNEHKIEDITVPREIVWKLYGTTVVRRLMRSGLDIAQAAMCVGSRSPQAKAELRAILDEEIHLKWPAGLPVKEVIGVTVGNVNGVQKVQFETSRTVADVLAELPDGYRERALANAWSPQGPVRAGADLPHTLRQAFRWSTAPEGYDFWDAVCDRLSRGEPLPPTDAKKVYDEMMSAALDRAIDRQVGVNQETEQNETMSETTENWELIPHDYTGTVIAQRASDGYVNATAMCTANGKLVGHYLVTEGSKKYLKALAPVIGITITGLVLVRQGGTPSQQGTWVHPRVAVDLARWCSPDFAVWVDGWVYNWMRGQPAAPVLDLTDPAFLRSALRKELDAHDETCLKLTHVTTERDAAVVQLSSEVERSGALEARVDELEPIAEAYAHLTRDGDGMYAISTVAKHIHDLVEPKVSQPILFEFLRWEVGAVYVARPEATQWVIDKGYMTNKFTEVRRTLGPETKPTPKFTIKGVEWITQKYMAWLKGDDGMLDQSSDFILGHYREKLRESLRAGRDIKPMFWKFSLALRRNRVTSDLAGLDVVEQAMRDSKLKSSRQVLDAVGAL